MKIQLMTFVEVANRRTMANAARHLKITPAAVSKQILALENTLGVELFKRSTRRVELTPEGLLFFEHAKQILEAYQQAEAALSHSKEEPAGLLKVVCGPQFGYRYLIPHLQEFLKRYPRLRLQIEMTQSMPDLEKEKVDVVVGLTARIPVNCIQKSLILTRMVLCASPAYLERCGVPQMPSDLSQHQIITHTMREPDNRLLF